MKRMLAGLVVSVLTVSLIHAEEKGLQGPWVGVRFESDEKHEVKNASDLRLHIDESRLVLIRRVQNVANDQYRYTIDPTATPQRIELTDNEGKVRRGLYEIKDGRLTLCIRFDETAKEPEWPTSLDGGKGSKRTLLVFERLKPREIPAEVRALWKKLEGRWTVSSIETNGVRNQNALNQTLVFDPVSLETVLILTNNDRQTDLRFPTIVSEGGLMDFELEKGRLAEGIYEIKENELRICINPADAASAIKDRPTEFMTKEGTPYILLIAQREKP